MSENITVSGAAGWGAGLLLAGGAALWLMRGRAWGVAQFVPCALVLVGGLLLIGLLLPAKAVRMVENDRVGAEVPVRDGQRVRATRDGTAPTRIEMSPEERERELRRMRRAGSLMAAGVFAWLALRWKRGWFRGFLGLQTVAVWVSLAGDLRAHPLNGEETLLSLAIAAAMGAVAYFLFRPLTRENFRPPGN